MTSLLPTRRPSRGGQLASCLLAALTAGHLQTLPLIASGQGSALPETQLPATVLYDYDLPTPGSYSLPPIMAAGDGVVLDAQGRRQSLRQLQTGRICVLSFIYTRCPDPRACPMATGALRTLHAITAQDPELAAQLNLITMSFDPAFDTPKVMKSFAAANHRHAEGAPWQFLTTPSEETLQPILQAYGQVVDRRPEDITRRLYHPVRVYLIDRAGQIRNIYSFGLLDPRVVVTDVRTLLLEEAAQPTETTQR